MLSDQQLIDIRNEIQRRNPRGVSSAPNIGAGYTAAEVRVMTTLDRFKRVARRPYPTWAEVLAVLVALGYRDCSEDGAAVEAAMERRRQARNRCSVCGRAG